MLLHLILAIWSDNLGIFSIFSIKSFFEIENSNVFKVKTLKTGNVRVFYLYFIFNISPSFIPYRDVNTPSWLTTIPTWTSSASPPLRPRPSTPSLHSRRRSSPSAGDRGTLRRTPGEDIILFRTSLTHNVETETNLVASFPCYEFFVTTI